MFPLRKNVLYSQQLSKQGGTAIRVGKRSICLSARPEARLHCPNLIRKPLLYARFSFLRTSLRQWMWQGCFLLYVVDGVSCVSSSILRVNSHFTMLAMYMNKEVLLCISNCLKAQYIHKYFICQLKSGFGGNFLLIKVNPQFRTA
jgi:hypothetical protein